MLLLLSWSGAEGAQADGGRRPRGRSQRKSAAAATTSRESGHLSVGPDEAQGRSRRRGSSSSSSSSGKKKAQQQQQQQRRQRQK
ncbi:hypothetical protein MPTK1_7g14490 [Marchantia polymorpha subsp. ruderalis]|uniref:Uncharacterized protein n=2 Tax=Marchantia polymorpha TaxID=3197 RepID=A0AAF6BZK2_MARPO|nr:hypothetical protein MARPO_0009s0134 [Marchantia polymorpha]BBN17436.1 hypothetical protein Mp_7g14490 [Marchantia polymorpha subsp. ruderalis]|eukprot:PTQ47043.1 hypothetical protein MARPO_0009s0134 [Marchantia polymorpha]